MLSTLHIAGISVALHDVDPVLAELDRAYVAFSERQALYTRNPENPHLCFEGCSSCCRSGAFFAVSLAEALRWQLAIRELPALQRERVRTSAHRLLEIQRAEFARALASPDVPGRRDEAAFTARVARVAAAGAACPLLEADRCSVYAHRPFLCRAYGFPVDAYAVEADEAIVFRSLCSLYEGRSLHDYIRARELHMQLGALSHRLAGGRDLGRFTSAEAILAEAT